MKILKWTIFIVLTIIILLVISAYILFKSNPNYVVKHLEKNPESSALYVSVDNNKKIAYQADKPRPLASVAKIIIALEYAYQIKNGDISEDETVPLSSLEAFYIEDTDGGAHEAWLEEMEEEDNIHEESVTLHDVASGMITYSSNANADFLMDLLGVENIDQRMSDLELEHDPIIPFTGSLAAVGTYKQENDNWKSLLDDMSEEEYQDLAVTTLEEMKNEEMNLDDVYELSIDDQRIWSDRLAHAPAETYGKLLNAIANGDFPEEVTATIQDLMEWPMEKVEENKDYYKVIGSKGGSTAFVFNDTMYAEDLEGKQLQIVLLTDDLSEKQFKKLSREANGFMVEMINNEDFLDKAADKLQP